MSDPNRFTRPVRRRAVPAGENVAVLPVVQAGPELPPEPARWPAVVAGILTVAWVTLCLAFAATAWGLGNLLQLLPHELGGFVAGLAAPVLLLWVIVSVFQRRHDVQAVAAPIYRQLREIGDGASSSRGIARSALGELRAEADRIAATLERVTENAQMLQDLLLQQNQALSMLSTTAKQDLGGVETAVAESVARLQQLTQKVDQGAKDFEGKTTKFSTDLKGAVEQALDRADEMADRLNEGAGALDGRTAQAIATLDRLSKLLDEGVTGLSSTVSGAEDRMAVLADAVDGGRSRLDATLDRIGEEAKALGDLFSGKADQLDGAIAAAHTKVADTMDQRLAALAKEAETIDEAFKAGEDRLRLQSDDRLNALEHRLNDLRDALGGVISSGVAALQGTFDEKVDGITGGIGGFTETARQLSDRLQQPITSIHEAQERLFDLSREMGDTLRDRADGLIAAGDRAINQTERLAGDLSQRADQVALLSGKVAADTTQVSDRLRTEADRLELLGTRAGDVLIRLASEAEEGTNGVNTLANTLEARLNSLAAMMADGRRHLDESAGKVSELSQRSFQALEDQTTALSRAADAQERSVGRAAEEVERAVERLGAQGHTAREQIGGLIASVEAVPTRLDALAGDVTKRLETVAASFEARLQTFKTQAGSAAKAYGEAEQRFARQEEALGQVIDRSSTELRNMAKLIERQATDLTHITEQTGQKNAAARKALEAQGRSLSETIGRAMGQLEQVNQTMADTASATTHRTDTITARLGTVADEAATRMGQLTETAQSAVDKFTLSTRQMRAHAAKSGEAMEARTNALMSARDQISRAIEQLSDESQGVTERLENASNAIAHQSNAIAMAQESMETGLDRSVNGLAQAIDRLTMATETARARMAQVTGALDSSAERLDTATDGATEKAENVALLFGEQSDALRSAADSAMEQADALREAGLHIRREAFLDAAKFVIESLHSLTVDFNRLVDEEVPDKVWKSFYQGDTTAFTKRFLTQRDRLPVDTIRARYEDDGEFRGYVQRYIRQFEELLDEATERDHSELLSSTVMTSDVGKVYVLLCTAIGRERELLLEE